MTEVRSGLESLREQGFAALEGRRIGLMTNPSAVDRDLNSAYEILRHSKAVQLAALFGPEHGFLAAAADGEHISGGTDPRTGLPVHSLYGATLRPTPEMLDGLALMVCDIQDIGVRYYTFTWTITHILEACGAAGLPVLILDRPNPLGEMLAGPLLDAAYESLVGRVPVPVCHGMTLGELAGMFNNLWNPTPAQLTVIPCTGWSRSMRWSQTGLPFVPPSPNMPHYETVLQYPGACFIEGTTLSEGRGTTLPFEVVGAPYIDSIDLAAQLNALDLPGVRFRPHSFRPAASKHQGATCGGVQVHITDATAFDAMRVWLHLIQTIRRTYPDDFAWLLPYREGYHPHFDLLAGSGQLRAALEAGDPVESIMADWDAGLREFAALREPYLLY